MALRERRWTAMQVHGDFIFHLDEPREQFLAGHAALRGWITTQRELSDLRICGQTERRLELEERPDVRQAFPNYLFATGFHDKVEPLDLQEDALHFSFAVGGALKIAVEHLLPPPPIPSGLSRVWAKLCRFIALQRLRFAPGSYSRWNAGLSAFLLEIWIHRGGDFRRDEIDRLIALFADVFPDAFVVQIGANDGATFDPLAICWLLFGSNGHRTKPPGLVTESYLRRANWIDSHVKCIVDPSKVVAPEIAAHAFRCVLGKSLGRRFVSKPLSHQVS